MKTLKFVGVEQKLWGKLIAMYNWIMKEVGKKTEVHCHALLEEIFLTQGSNSRLLRLLYCQVDSLPLSHRRSPCLQNVFFELSFELPVSFHLPNDF